MAVSINWGSISWVSLEQEPYCFVGSIVGPLIVGNSNMPYAIACHNPNMISKGDLVLRVLGSTGLAASE